MTSSFSRVVVLSVACFGFLGIGPARGVEPDVKCQFKKNKIAGKYAYCRQKAEAKALVVGGAADYSKCESQFADKFDREEVRGEGQCPDDVTSAGMDTFVTQYTDQVAAILGGTTALPTCGDNSINVAGEQCDGTDLGGESCLSLGFDSGTLACTSCVLDTSGCDCLSPSGDAVAADVLEGKTFSKDGAAGLTGTMPDRGSVTLTPGTANQAILAGYHAGKGYCEGDANLVSSNIRSGANIFGVAGDSNVVNTSSGDAVAGNILSGKKAWVDGAEVTGNVPAGSNVNGGEGSKTFTIPNGLYSGSKTATANDADLLAANIKTGVTIFGVTGSLLAGLPETGQTTVYVAGDDGSKQAGLTRSFTNHGNGTITDNATGLMWEVKCDGTPPDCPAVNDKDTTYTWANAFAGHVATLNGGSGFAGYTDWRVPNSVELATILDWNQGNSSPPTTFSVFDSCGAECTVMTCSCTASAVYWSSTTRARLTTNAWGVDFSVGDFYYYTKTTATGRVRAVRGGS